MDTDDGKKRFVSSVLTYFFDRGYLTDKQMDALRGVASKVIKRYLEQDLQCQGSAPAQSQTLDFGNVIHLSRARNCEVLE